MRPIRQRNRPSERTPQTPDPLMTGQQGAPFGGGAMVAPQNVIERGVIVRVDAQRHAYWVHLNSGRTVPTSRVRSHAGDMTLLPVGSAVMVTFAIGLPYILGVLPSETESTAEDNPQSITDVEGFGGNDPTLSKNIGATSRGRGEPRDIGPGDFVGMSPGGSSVAALQGGVAQIRGSALSKVQAFGDSDLVQIVCGVMRTVTWMGESEVVNNNGKTSFIWRGGTDQLTQTGHDEERYTIRLDAGDLGNMIKLEVCNLDNQVLFRFHVSPTGKLELFSAGGMTQHIGSADGQTHPIRFHGSKSERISSNSTVNVGGNAQSSVDGNLVSTVSLNESTTVGQDQNVTVNRNQNVNIGGDANEIVAGKKVVNSLDGYQCNVLLPGSVHAVKLVLGDSTIETGGGDHRVQTLGGAIRLLAGIGELSALASRITLASSGAFTISAAPGSIEIGDGASSGVAKWEELNAAVQALTAQLSALHGLVAAHTHIGTAPADPTLTPLGRPLFVDLTAARSTVRIG